MTEYTTNEYDNGVKDEFGVLYSEDGLKLIEITKDLESYRVKEGTEIICDQAFYRCYMLKSIYIPDSVTEIGKEVFEDCFRLSDIHFSKNLTDIGLNTLFCFLLNNTLKNDFSSLESKFFIL